MIVNVAGTKLQSGASFEIYLVVKNLKMVYS